jgi:hypothetical protein
MPSLRELRHRDALSQRCDGRLGTSLTSRRRRRRPVLLGGGSVEALSYAVYASPPDRCADRSKPPLRGLSGGRVSLARGRGLPCQAAPRHMVSTAERTSLVVPGPRRDRGASYPARDRARRPRLLADGASATLGHRPVAAEAARWLSEVTCARYGARRRQRVGAAGHGGDAGRNASHSAARRSTTRLANRRGKPQPASPRVAASPCRPARWAGSPAAVRADLDAPQQQAPHRALAPTRTLKLRGSPGCARTWSIAPRSPSIPGALRRGVLG